MAQKDSIQALRIVGGHPALDFANTVASRRDRLGPDRLTSYADLLDWAVRVDLLATTQADILRDRHAARASAALERALALRESIFAIGAAVAAGRPAPVDAIGVLDTAARHARSSQMLSGEAGEIRLRLAREDDIDTVTHLVAGRAADLFTDPARRARVKECPGRNCGWLFLDTSRNGRRRWCSEEECGMPTRVRRHRARKAAGPGGPQG